MAHGDFLLGLGLNGTCQLQSLEGAPTYRSLLAASGVRVQRFDSQCAACMHGMHVAMTRRAPRDYKLYEASRVEHDSYTSGPR
jgi:hypothetical protein